MDLLAAVDARIAPDKFPPRWGWHDDHRSRDGTPGYLPALQQVRGEFSGLLDVLKAAPGVLGGRCLQLGMGECDASHEVWRAMFAGGAVTLDWSGLYVDGRPRQAGGDTHDSTVGAKVVVHGPYDFLFVDAGHSFEDVRLDHRDYGPLVRKGGIVAFHDSLPRKAYEEVEVWRYLETLGDRVHQIGTEVGIAWLRQE